MVRIVYNLKSQTKAEKFLLDLQLFSLILLLWLHLTMYLSTLVATNALLASATAAQLLTDINQIQKYWGEMTPYSDNDENYFGVDYVGLPEGCQVVRSFLHDPE